jgi:Leucine-rich repeat (LRR) protein
MTVAMKGRHVPVIPAAPRTPARSASQGPPHRNTGWLHYNDGDSVLVFIHGVLSDNRNAWLHREGSEVYWPDLIQSDSRFGQPAIFLGGYHTAITSGEFGIRDCAREVFDSLCIPDARNNPAVMEKPAIVFICHSLGGIIARYMLEANQHAFASKRLGLVLIASPSYGSKYANAIVRLSRLYKNKTGQELQWGSWGLDDLDRRFRTLKEERMRHNLFGIEFCEHHFYQGKWFSPLFKLMPFLSPAPIVPRESAMRYFSDVTMIANSDHESICKPSSTDEQIHGKLFQFLRESKLLRTPPQQPGLMPVSKHETEQAVEALRRLPAWVRTSDPARHREALDALRKALVDTRRYVTSEERDDGTEKILSKLWHDVAEKLWDFDSQLAVYCDVKGHGWADKRMWKHRELAALPVTLDEMLAALVKAQVTVAAEPDIPSAVTKQELNPDTPTATVLDRIDAEIASQATEAAIRKALDIPHGKLFPEDLAKVTQLDLSGKPVSTLARLQSIENLITLNLENCSSLTDLRPIEELKHLAVLNLKGCTALWDLRPLAGSSELIGLNLQGCESISDFQPLENLRALQSLDLSDCRLMFDLTPIARMHKLRYLSLMNCRLVRDLRPLDHLHSLFELYLQGCADLEDLSPLASLMKLKALDLGNCTRLTSIGSLWPLRNLEYIGLRDCPAIEDFSALSQMPKLPSLILTGCTGLKDLTPLRTLRGLRTLVMSHCTGIEDLAPLAGLPDLAALALNGCIGIRDLSPLIQLPRLRELHGQG